MTAFLHHLSYDFRTGLRDKSLMLMNYLFPLVFYAMMGAIFSKINPGFSATMIPAMIVNAMMASALLGLPNPIVASRESGIYRSFRINGVPAISILTIPVVGTVLHILLVSVIITATAKPLFSADLPVHWGYFVLITIISSLNMAGIGVLIGVVSNSGRSTVLLAQVLYLPSMILGGLMMPASLLPEGMAKIATLLPASHVMRAYEGLAMESSAVQNPLVSIFILAASTLIAFLVSTFLFSWDSRTERKQTKNWLALLAFLPFIAYLVWTI